MTTEHQIGLGFKAFHVTVTNEIRSVVELDKESFFLLRLFTMSRGFFEDTLGCIMELEDEVLYTAGTAAATKYDPLTELAAYERLRRRLLRLKDDYVLADVVDGSLGAYSAWLGKTWKTQINEEELKNYIDHPPDEDEPTPQPARQPSFTRSIPLKWPAVMVISCLCVTSTLALMIWPNGSVPQDNTAVRLLFLPRNDKSIPLRDMVYESVKHLGVTPITATTLDEAHLILNEEITLEKLDALRSLVKADIIVWGDLENHRGRGPRWTGTVALQGKMLQKRFDGEDLIQIAGKLAESIGKLIRTDKYITPPMELFSTNESANIIYSEALNQYQTGNYLSAMPFFRRAGTLYDPNFHLAKIMEASCLEKMGLLNQAIDVLQPILAKGDAVNPILRLLCAKLLCDRIYFKQFAFDKLLAQSEQAGMIARQERLDDLYLHFLQLESRVYLLQGKQAEAQRTMERLQEYAETAGFITPKVKANILVAQAKISANAGELQTALKTLDEAIRLCEAQFLYQELLDGLSAKSKLIWHSRKVENMHALLNELERVSAIFRDKRVTSHDLPLNYLTTMTRYYLGREDDALNQMKRIHKKAMENGLLEPALKTLVILVDIALDRQDLLEAEELLRSMENQIGELPHEYAAFLLDRFITFWFVKGDPHKSLSYLEEAISRYSSAGREDAVGRMLNRKGVILMKMMHLHEAEMTLLKSYTMLIESNDRDAKVCAGNLALLYQKQNRADLAHKYRQIWKDL